MARVPGFGGGGTERRVASSGSAVKTYDGKRLMKYSVLMSVYANEKADNLSTSVESMLLQTVKPEQIVIVKDGPLTPELDELI